MPVVPRKSLLKRCPKCGRNRKRSSFVPNKARYDGFASYCRSCMSKYNRRYRKKENTLKRAQEWAIENPDKIRLTQIVAYLKRVGSPKPREEVQLDLINKIHCPYCDVILDWTNLSYDHKNGKGSDTHPVCITCNLIKHIFTHDDFILIVKIIGIDKLKEY